MREPAEYAAELERDATLPTGSEERFSGYGVMGLPFRSGHILGLRYFPASSIGPGYRSVWHRGPRGRWTFYQDQPAELACTRYFGAAVEEIREGPIDITWTGPRSFEVSADGGELVWRTELASTPVTSALNRVAPLLPDRAWRSPPILAAMARAAGFALRAGRVRLTGLRTERTALRRQSLADVDRAREHRPCSRHRPRCDRAGTRAGATARLRDPPTRSLRRGSRLLRAEIGRMIGELVHPIR
jgi:hypothetical protein